MINGVRHSKPDDREFSINKLSHGIPFCSARSYYTQSLDHVASYFGYCKNLTDCPIMRHQT